jgi:hypothetical protein
MLPLRKSRAISCFGMGSSHEPPLQSPFVNGRLHISPNEKAALLRQFSTGKLPISAEGQRMVREGLELPLRSTCCAGGRYSPAPVNA